MVNKNEGDVHAQVNIWKYVFGFTDMAVVRCAIELGIPDILENQACPMTLSELSSTIGCSPSTLYRIMRFLVQRCIFNEKPIEPTTTSLIKSKGYVKTHLSSFLTKNGDKTMSDLILFLSSPVILAPLLGLSKRVVDCNSNAFEASNGKDIWSYAEEDFKLSMLIDNAMSNHAKLVVPTIIETCPDLFLGLESIVDVGGGNGTTLRLLLKAFPHIHGINFDLPRVVATAEAFDGVEHIGGDMFQTIPKADAVFIMWVLHDWGDEECIKILRNCMNAIHEKKGKVIIVEVIIKEDCKEEEENDDKLEFARLMMDITLMAETEKGKERTMKEWEHVLDQAGFFRHTVKRINDHRVESVIVAYP